MVTILTMTGLVLFVAGGFLLILEAFNQNILWGLACLFITPVTFLFVARYWEAAKKPFLTEMAGFVLILIGMILKNHSGVQPL